MVSAILRLAWGFRLELSMLATIGAAWSLATRATGTTAGSLAVGLPLTALVTWPVGRRWLWRHVRFAHVRRRFASAVRTSTFDRSHTGGTPTVLRVRETSAGYMLRVRVPGGTSVIDLEKAAEVTAAAMGVSDIRVARDRSNASVARVAVVCRDPLAESGPLAWPLVQASRCSLWEPIPVGLDEDGNSVAVSSDKLRCP